MLCLSSRCTACASRRSAQRGLPGGCRTVMTGGVHFSHQLNEHLAVLALAGCFAEQACGVGQAGGVGRAAPPAEESTAGATTTGLLLKAGDGLEPADIVACCAVLDAWRAAGTLQVARARVLCVPAALPPAGGDGEDGTAGGGRGCAVLIACEVRVWLQPGGGARTEEHTWGDCSNIIISSSSSSSSSGTVAGTGADASGDAIGALSSHMAALGTAATAPAAVPAATTAPPPPPPPAPPLPPLPPLLPPPPPASSSSSLSAMLDAGAVPVRAAGDSASAGGQRGAPPLRGRKQPRKPRAKANGNRVGRFADWLVREFGHELLAGEGAGAGGGERRDAGHVLDVAGGGQSGLAWELCVRRGAGCVVVDPRAVNLDGRRMATLARRGESAEGLCNAWRRAHARCQEAGGAGASGGGLQGEGDGGGGGSGGARGGRGGAEGGEQRLRWPWPLQLVYDSLRHGGRCEPRQLCTLFGDEQCRAFWA